MIYIYTGTPGAGKTMCLVAEAIGRGETEKRPVYVSGIPGLAGSGIFELPDAADWMSVPDGSIVVIDEAQRVFPARLAKVEVPACIRAMETHRHRGIDIYIATQSVSMLDVHLRRLGNVHRHLVRVFGLRASTVYEWDEVCEDTRDKGARRLSRKSRFKFQRKYFSRYRSMTIDTAQRRIPWLLKWGIPVIVVAVVAAIYGVHREIAGMAHHFTAHALAAKVGGRALPPGYTIVSGAPRAAGAVQVAAHRRRRHADGWRLAGVVVRGSRVWAVVVRHGDDRTIKDTVCRGVGDWRRCRVPGHGWVGF
jgi:hypothetical protein